MARLRATTSKNVKYYSIIEDYYRNGKRTTKTLLNLGSNNKIAFLASEANTDSDTYLKNCLNKYLETYCKDKNKEDYLLTNNKVVMDQKTLQRGLSKICDKLGF